MMNVEYYKDKARDIVWENIDTNKLLDDEELKNIDSVTGIVAKLLEIIGELDERVTNLEKALKGEL